MSEESEDKQKRHVTLVTITSSHIALLALYHHHPPSLCSSLPALVDHRDTMDSPSFYMRFPTLYAHLHQISPSNSRARYRMSFRCPVSHIHPHPVPHIVQARLRDPATLFSAPCQRYQVHRELTLTVAIQPAYAKQVSPSLQVSADRVPYRCLMSAAAFDSRHRSPLSALVGAASTQAASWYNYKAITRDRVKQTETVWSRT
ncbi:hypothetical protein R3P38DRAFT_2775655 [Favolaschia claudopus]|uniref:Uncharacterized protein n=1 Tax=Favolaschia claudopus TaxID=2862362 RepID=A0AAW0BU63_9AGAR